MIVALDWRTSRVLARSQFPTLIGPLAKSGKDLWALQVKPAALLRLDPLTLSPTAAPIQLSPGRAVGLAAAGGDVWTTEPDSGDVLRIDTATRSVSRVHVGGFPAGVAVAAGKVWFADRDGARSVDSTRRRFARPGAPSTSAASPGGWRVPGGTCSPLTRREGP